MSVSLNPTFAKLSSSVNNQKNDMPTNANKPKPTNTINGLPLPGTKRLNYSPITIGALNGLCWTGVGMLLDKFSAKLFKTKLNTKVSFALQGAFGLYMGYRAYKVAKNEIKNA